MKRRYLLFSVVVAMTASLLTWLQPAAGAEGPPATAWSTDALDASAFAGRTATRRPAGALIASRDGVTESSVSCSPFWFTGVGVTWDHGGPARVGVRFQASPDGSTFGPTRELHTSPDHGPDHGTGEAEEGLLGSPLLWTGGSRCVRIAFELRDGQSLADLQVHFVNTSGTAAGPDAPVASGPRVATAPGGMASAEAWTKQPDIIMRDAWGARKRNTKPSCNDIQYADAVKVAFVHHTDNPNNYAKSESDDIMRAIQAYHINGQHWCDIAYNFLIDKYGQVFEGREGGITEPVISGATQGVNTGSTSVALIGSYQHARPTRPEIAALKKLLAWRLDIAHARPGGKDTLTSLGGDNTKYNNGDEVHLRVISGHRDTGYTDCPGNRTYRMLRKIRTAVTKIGLPKIYYPTRSRGAMEQGDAEGVRFKAQGSMVLNWTLEIADADDATVVRTITQTGNPMSILWRGNDDTDAQVAPGLYDVTISAQNDAGKVARSAHLQFRIKAPSA